jgi:hypothetical protein
MNILLVSSSISSFFFFVGLEFELKASYSQNRHSTTQVIPLVHFALVILEMGYHELFAHWPRTAILPNSASQGARITGVSHQHPDGFNSFLQCFVVFIIEVFLLIS